MEQINQKSESRIIQKTTCPQSCPTCVEARDRGLLQPIYPKRCESMKKIWEHWLDEEQIRLCFDDEENLNQLESLQLIYKKRINSFKSLNISRLNMYIEEIDSIYRKTHSYPNTLEELIDLQPQIMRYRGGNFDVSWLWRSYIYNKDCPEYPPHRYFHIFFQSFVPDCLLVRLSCSEIYELAFERYKKLIPIKKRKLYKQIYNYTNLSTDTIYVIIEYVFPTLEELFPKESFPFDYDSDSDYYLLS